MITLLSAIIFGLVFSLVLCKAASRPMPPPSFPSVQKRP
jgi:hypothetical protein